MTASRQASTQTARRTASTKLAFAVALCCAGAAGAADYSPNVGAAAPMRLLWGDTHVHTGWSGDAGGFGAKLTPEDAVRFARGETIVASTGQPARLDRSLDWVVIADHSEGMGLIQELVAQNPAIVADPTGKRWSEMMLAGGEQGFKAALELIGGLANKKLPAFASDKRIAAGIWQRNTAIQEKYYEPGRFTTLIGYEWSAMPGGGDNLHRNVIFRDGKDKADVMPPFSALDSDDPEDLWKWMQAWEDKTGGKLLAIPHNGNISNGRMFALATLQGNPLTRAYAEARARWEPLYEVTQIKGDGETHPAVSPDDEFANFERWDWANLNNVPKKPEQLKTEYARQALKDGLALEARLGANPFKFGLIGSTDTHTGLSTAAANNFFGKHSRLEPGPNRVNHPLGPGVMGWQMASSGYAAVWAQDNTREAIWDALKRKEVYGTTGPRMAVRLFAGFDFKPGDELRADMAALGYAKGVPMGGELKVGEAKVGSGGTAPSLMIVAAKDPLGANLDRVQVIKGWLDATGAVREKVYDVAWSGQREKSRKPGKNGKLPPVGNTVDVASASYSNAIGAAQLTVTWRDPAFDPKQRAFYYVRVLEIPTPRWTVYDARFFGTAPAPQAPTAVQQRAYTSPVWVSPI